jgi:hypothetical protein
MLAWLRSIDWVLFAFGFELILKHPVITPHPNPLPQGERERRGGGPLPKSGRGSEEEIVIPAKAGIQTKITRFPLSRE